MANTVLTADIIAKEAVMILDNELVMGRKVFRGYENEFDGRVNGYKKGDTITIRKPTDFTVRDGPVMDAQEVTEGKTTIVVDQRKGVDFKFTSQDLTLKIGELSERVIKPAMIQLANQIDRDVLGLYKYVPNWVGATGETVNSFADFAKAPQRLDEFAVPMEGRAAILSPADHWALLGSQTALYMQDVAKGAYRQGSLGMIGGVDTYMSQNVPVHITGSDITTVTVNQALTTSTTAYADVKDTMQQTITIAGGNLNPGDVITIEDVNAVNPVTKADLGFAKQFTVISYSSNSLVLYPALIWTGAFQNVAVTAGVTDLTGKTITAIGAAGAINRANLVFHRNAFALAMVPMVAPPGAPSVSRQSYKGTSVRLIPTYDGTNDRSNFRLDCLYGVKALDPRLATRLSGSS
jgi:hypothetical protein